METQNTIARRFGLTDADSRWLDSQAAIRKSRDSELATIRNQYEPRLTELRAIRDSRLEAWRTGNYRNRAESNRARANIFRTEESHELARLEREMNDRLNTCHDRFHALAGRAS